MKNILLKIRRGIASFLARSRKCFECARIQSEDIKIGCGLGIIVAIFIMIKKAVKRK